MRTFEIEITETLQAIEQIEANNFEEAFCSINEKYKNEEIILTANEHIDTEISPYIHSHNYSKIIKSIKFKEYILNKAEQTINEMSIEELIKLAFGDIENAINSFKDE